MNNATIVNRFDDGVTLNLTKDAADALASILGSLVDVSEAGFADEVFDVLVDGFGADYTRYKVNTVDNPEYDAEDPDDLPVNVVFSDPKDNE